MQPLDAPLPLQRLFSDLMGRLESLHTLPTLADPAAIQDAIANLPKELPSSGHGVLETLGYVQRVILPGLSLGQAGPRYFGFVTGGVVPAALYGDVLASIYDQNVQVHLPAETISTVVEAKALEMVLDLLDLPRDRFPLRTITTGATASNILGLAAGRDFAVKHALNDENYSVAEDGFGGVTVKVLTDRPHASLIKAASLVGIGRSNVIDLYNDTTGRFDLDQLERHLTASPNSAKEGFIVSPSFGEVNTGEFTTQMREIRDLCDRYNVWIHVDAAFGAFVRVVPELRHLGAGLELADSITGDGHKWLNVPYDAGLFFSRSVSLQTSIFGPSPRSAPPAYLATSSAPSPFPAEITSIPSPLNIGIENSRRFRGLAMFCALHSLGRDGYEDLVRRNIAFARRIGVWLSDPAQGGRWYELLNASYTPPTGSGTKTPTTSEEATTPTRVVPLNIVLFRSKLHEGGSARLIQAINDTRKMYVSPGKGGAVRLAVSNWLTGLREDADGKGDYEIVVDTLRSVAVAE